MSESKWSALGAVAGVVASAIGANAARTHACTDPNFHARVTLLEDKIDRLEARIAKLKVTDA